MKLYNVKKKLKKTFIVAVLVIPTFSGIAYAAYLWSAAQVEEEQKLRQGVAQITGQISQSESEYSQLIQSLDIYSGFPERFQPTEEGYDKASSRIRAARPVIERLKDKYHLGGVDITFTNISEQANPNNEPNAYTTVSNQMEVRFQAISDELVFAFIHDLINQFTGYLTIDNLDLRRTRQINDQLFEALETTNQFIPLIDGTLLATWTTLKGEPIKIKVEDIELLNRDGETGS